MLITGNGREAHEHRTAELDRLRLTVMRAINKAFAAVDCDDATVCAVHLDQAAAAVLEWRKVQCHE